MEIYGDWLLCIHRMGHWFHSADVDYAGCVFENYRQNRGTEECINALINLTMNWMLPVIVVLEVVGAVCAIWR